MASLVFVGLDCGGTTTRVVASDSQGDLLFRGQSGAANLASTPDAVIRASLSKATDGCPSANAVCGCFAGLLTPMDRERALGMLGEVFPNARARAESDAAAAFYAAELKPDVCVIAGTGSLVCSEGPNGLIRSGGRGYLLGDEGSAFRLGRSFVRAYLDDPKDVSERVKSEMVDAFGTTEPAEIVAALYKLPAPVQALAKFAKVLGEELKDGNARWHGIAVTEASELATVAADHAKRYLPMAPKLRVSLAGGVWKILGMSEAFTLALTEKLSESVIKVEVSRRPPVLGAVALAMEIQLGN